MDVARRFSDNPRRALRPTVRAHRYLNQKTSVKIVVLAEGGTTQEKRRWLFN